jgi:amidase
MKLSEYVEYDAVGLARLITSGQVSAREVQQVARQAMQSVNPELNALVGELFDEPLPYAADGPFAGVPFAIKDLGIHAQGVPTRMGSRLTGQGIRFPYDSELMTRFKRAGLATLGRTSCPEFGINATAESLANGPTRNPWDTALTTGGSSGGSGALVAARALPVAHGNDSGGSIRQPAAWCGLVGLKPTRGRISTGPDYDELLYGQGIEFALTRTVRDAAALLDAVNGPGIGDKYEIVPPARPYSEEIGMDPGHLRVAITTRAWSGAPVDREHVGAIESIERTLDSLGHKLEEASPQLDWEVFLKSQLSLFAAFVADGATGLSAALGKELGPDVLEAVTLSYVEYGRRVTALDLNAALRTNNLLSRSVGAFFRDYDVLLTPTMATLPQALGYFNQNDPTIDPLTWLHKNFTEVEPFTSLFNATGQPAISLPLAQSSSGLPIGVHLVTRYGDEATLFRLAAQLEQVRPWAERKPRVVAAAH